MSSSRARAARCAAKRAWVVRPPATAATRRARSYHGLPLAVAKDDGASSLSGTPDRGGISDSEDSVVIRGASGTADQAGINDLADPGGMSGTADPCETADPCDTADPGNMSDTADLVIMRGTTGVVCMSGLGGTSELGGASGVGDCATSDAAAAGDEAGQLCICGAGCSGDTGCTVGPGGTFMAYRYRDARQSTNDVSLN